VSGTDLPPTAQAASDHYRTRRFILRTPRAERELEAVARMQGWTCVGERPAGGGNPLVIIYATPLPGVSVWYFAFDDPDLCGVAVDSTGGANAIEPVAQLVQGLLVPWTLTELIAELDSAAAGSAAGRAADSAADRAASRQSALAAALQRAGLGAPTELDSGWLSRFTTLAADPDPEVRRAVIWAVAATEWQRMCPLLEAMAERDRKRSVRKYARTAARALSSITPGWRPVAVPDLLPADAAADLYDLAMSNLRESDRTWDQSLDAN